MPRYVINPATGNRVLATSTTGRVILKKRSEKRRRTSRSGKRMRPLSTRKKTRKGTRKKTARKAKPSFSNFCSRRRSAKTCGSHPDCKWRPKSKSCVRHKNVRSGRAVYHGPVNRPG